MDSSKKQELRREFEGLYNRLEVVEDYLLSDRTISAPNSHIEYGAAEIVGNCAEELRELWRRATEFTESGGGARE